MNVLFCFVEAYEHLTRCQSGGAPSRYLVVSRDMVQLPRRLTLSSSPAGGRCLASSTAQADGGPELGRLR